MPSYSLNCTKCGECCNSGPAILASEFSHYKDKFIFGIKFNTLKKAALATALADALESEQEAAWQHLAARYRTFSIGGVEHLLQAIPYDCGYNAGGQGKGCPQLLPSGSCSLYEDRPTICRSLPADPSLPESLQSLAMNRFGRIYKCVTVAENVEGVGVWQDAKLLAPFKTSWDKFSAAEIDVQNQLAHMAATGALGTPRLEHMAIAPNGAVFASSIVPWLAAKIVLQGDQALRALASDEANSILESQLCLIDMEVKAALSRKNLSDRKTTERLRKWADDYRYILNRGGVQHLIRQ